VTAALRLMFSVRRVLFAPRFVALLAGPGLGEEPGRLETLFFEGASFLAAVRPLPLPPLRDLEVLVLAEVLLRDAAAFEARFLEALVFFAALRPRALAPPRALRVEALFFGDLAIRATPLRLDGAEPAARPLFMELRASAAV
jgi:hypothetical protein